jgi:NADH-quinone oxidoreductase subunit K
VTGVALEFLVVGAVLFALGAVGFLVRRNLIIMFLCVELMLQGATLNLVGFSRYHGNVQGQSFVIFLLTTAACESAIALALVVAIYTRFRTLDAARVSQLNERTEPGAKFPLDPSPAEPRHADYPTSPMLAPAGPEPPVGEVVRNLRPAGRTGETRRTTGEFTNV